MIKIFYSIIFSIVFISACKSDKKVIIKTHSVQYDSINLYLKNYNIESASKVWQKLDANIDKNATDSLRWMHEQVKVQIILSGNLFDSARLELLAILNSIDSNQFYDIYINLKRLQSVSELQLGIYNESINHAFEVLPYYEKSNNLRRVCGLKASISWAYFNLLAWEESQKYILESLKLANENNYVDLLSDYNQRLATIFAGQIQYDSINKQQKFDSAIFYFDKSLSYLDTNELGWDLSNLYLNKGSLYSLMNMPSASLIEYQKALAVNKSINDEQGIANCYSNLGLTYFNTEQYKLAEDVLLKAEVIASKIDDYNLLTAIHKNLAILYKKIGNFKASSNYFEKYINVYFIELENQNIENSKALSTKYEREKNEKEIQLYKNEQLKNKYQLLGLFFLLIFVITTSSIVFYIFRQRNKNKKLIDQINIDYEKKLLEQVTKENERIRISRNLHDNLGAYAASILNKIKMIESDLDTSYKVSELQELRLTAQQILLNLKSIVIDLNQKSLPFLEFLDQQKTELLRLLNSYPNIDFNITENIDFNFSVSPDYQFQIKSILFEMVYNALKHSNANLINLEIIETTDSINISVSDNGMYSNNIENPLGNGMKNIQSRLIGINGTLLLNKNKEGGTFIAVQLNKANFV